MTHTRMLLPEMTKATPLTLSWLVVSATVQFSRSVVVTVALRAVDQGCAPNHSHTKLDATYAMTQPRTDSAVR